MADDEASISVFNSVMGLSIDDALSSILAERNAGRVCPDPMESKLSASVSNSTENERLPANHSAQALIQDSQAVLVGDPPAFQPVPVPGYNYYRPLSRSTLLAHRSRLPASRPASLPAHRKPFYKAASLAEALPCEETVNLRHPHLHVCVPVKKSLVPCFLEQGYCLPADEV